MHDSIESDIPQVTYRYYVGMLSFLNEEYAKVSAMPWGRKESSPNIGLRRVNKN